MRSRCDWRLGRNCVRSEGDDLNIHGPGLDMRLSGRSASQNGVEVMRGIRERSLLLKRERGGKIPFLPTYLPTVVIICLSIYPSIHPSSKLHREELLSVSRLLWLLWFLTPLLRHLVDRLMRELFHHSPLVIIAVFFFIIIFILLTT